MKKKVLVVDDSILMQKIISDIVNSSQDFAVVATAKDSNEALNKFRRYSPDIVTLDFEMPKEDGLVILGRMLRERIIPVLMVSAHTKEGAEITLRALEMGAADFLTKPSGTVSIELYDLKEVLIDKLKTISHVNLSMLKLQSTKIRKIIPKKGGGFFVAIGTSTGGVRALYEIMPVFPTGSGLKGAVAVHMPRGFTQSLAERLNNKSQIVIREARQDDLILADQFLVAPGGEHSIVVMKEGEPKIDFADAPPKFGLKPCADLLFESVAEVYKDKAIGVVLTGMGRDGARGIEAIKDNGGMTIAEDPKTAIVAGMPKMAINTGKIDFVLGLAEIPKMIMELNSVIRGEG